MALTLKWRFNLGTLVRAHLIDYRRNALLRHVATDDRHPKKKVYNITAKTNCLCQCMEFWLCFGRNGNCQGSVGQIRQCHDGNDLSIYFTALHQKTNCFVYSITPKRQIVYSVTPKKQVYSVTPKKDKFTTSHKRKLFMPMYGVLVVFW